MDNNKEIDLRTASFSELLAHTAEADKVRLVEAVIKQAKDGDAAALKIISQALLDNQFKEDEHFVIPDERFYEIVGMAADARKAGEI